MQRKDGASSLIDADSAIAHGCRVRSAEHPTKLDCTVIRVMSVLSKRAWQVPDAECPARGFVTPQPYGELGSMKHRAGGAAKGARYIIPCVTSECRSQQRVHDT